MDPLSEEDNKYVKGFSWAAFFGTWVYLLANKQKKLGWKIFVLFILIQLFNILPWVMSPSNVLIEMEKVSKMLGFIYFGVCIWLSIRGREMVWTSKVYASVEEFKQKQIKVNKYISTYLIIIVLLAIVSVFIMTSKLAKNPGLIDQKIEQQALAKVKAENPNLNEQEFDQGYQKGLSEGRSDIDQSFIADQTSSYQDGYHYGYAVACMEVHNSQAYCLDKFAKEPKQN